jgi:hypothetical protein
MNPADQSQKEKMASCPSCGAENRDGAEFCDSCGTKLTDGSLIADMKWGMYVRYAYGSLTMGIIMIFFGIVLIVSGRLLLSILPFGVGMLMLAFAYVWIANKRSFVGGPDTTIPTADEAAEIESDFGRGLG